MYGAVACLLDCNVSLKNKNKNKRKYKQDTCEGERPTTVMCHESILSLQYF